MLQSYIFKDFFFPRDQNWINRLVPTTALFIPSKLLSAERLTWSPDVTVQVFGE